MENNDITYFQADQTVALGRGQCKAIATKVESYKVGDTCGGNINYINQQAELAGDLKNHFTNIENLANRGQDEGYSFEANWIGEKIKMAKLDFQYICWGDCDKERYEGTGKRQSFYYIDNGIDSLNCEGTDRNKDYCSLKYIESEDPNWLRLRSIE